MPVIFLGSMARPSYLIAHRSGHALQSYPVAHVHFSAHLCSLCPHLIAPCQVALCEDPSVLGTPFYLMQHVKGRIFNDPSLPSLPPDQRAAVYQASWEA